MNKWQEPVWAVQERQLYLARMQAWRKFIKHSLAAIGLFLGVMLLSALVFLAGMMLMDKAAGL